MERLFLSMGGGQLEVVGAFFAKALMTIIKEHAVTIIIIDGAA